MLQRSELGNGLREAAELIGCQVENLQRGEVGDGLREAVELVPMGGADPATAW